VSEVRADSVESPAQRAVRDIGGAPQLVRPETNLSFYRIVHEYYQLSGIPSMINTSFNMHEEPIVKAPQDAVRAFLQGKLDYLAIGNFLVRHPLRQNVSVEKRESRISRQEEVM